MDGWISALGLSKKQMGSHAGSIAVLSHPFSTRLHYRANGFSSQLMTDRDRAYFGRSGDSQDQIGFLDENTRSIFGRSYAAEPDQLIEELARDEAIAEADTLLLTVPNQLGVGYNTHVLESILTHVAPALGWR